MAMMSLVSGGVSNVSSTEHTGLEEIFPVLSEEPGQGGQWAEPESLPWPGLTTACKRRLPASARTSLPLPAAPDAQR